jgi:hypothetical protein
VDTNGEWGVVIFSLREFARGVLDRRRRGRGPPPSAKGITVYTSVEKRDHHMTLADLLPQPELPVSPPAAIAKKRWPIR